jgi:hypothetical protein
MNFVEPIRDRKKIAQIKNLLWGQKRFRDLFLFVVGINIALRISDLLQLQISHFLDEQERISGYPEQVAFGQPNELQIIGNLTLSGVTQPITFNVLLTIISPEERRGFATTTVMRSDSSIVNDADNGFDYHSVFISAFPFTDSTSSPQRVRPQGGFSNPPACPYN